MPDEDKLPPPSGDAQRAEGYVNQLIPLISENKLKVTHTDLSKFDPSSLHDHYSLDLKDYQIEISHSKQPTTGRDSYVILFNNLKNLAEGETQKEILAYLIISEEQFKKIKDVADEQIETLKKVEEEKRFKTAMDPLDKLFDQISKGEVDLSQTPQPVPEIPDQEKAEPDTTKPAEPTHEAQKSEEKPLADSAPIPLDTLNVMPPGVEERPEAKTPEAAPQPVETPAAEPISPLAAAAAIAVPETRSMDPLVPTIATAETHFEAPPLASFNQASPAYAQAATPAQAASIEEVQKALHQAYQKAGAIPQTTEFRPDLGHLSNPTNPSPPQIDPNVSHAPAIVGDNIVGEESIPATPENPQLDSAINDIFQPADNQLLTHAVKTPEV